MASETWLIAGLGNPGSRYRHTRHNIGHMVLDELLERMDAKYTRTKFGAKAVTARLGAGGPKVVFAVSEGYMNLSGKPVRGLMDYFSVPTQSLVVVHDELDLDFGRVKLKRGGSEGGHNGLKSITSHLGGDRDYLRVRAGVGRPPGRMDSADYVLQKFSAAEQKELGIFISRLADAVELLVSEGLPAAQNAVH
ncbi:aminoacyl-tRNA hydrolase [Nesterenkonia sandarakina]|uniref:Peptidyl-tRNA hydrolase n=1 Tax=Nesterenkonia sandarakina TaxID=272918 RepID=A0A7Z0E6U7_9MICC|nr:aminoacyl-tRNA hydrolase [Nesterenkonia sandarakina]NYJ15554.1 PTH1 family peptidyl-tRNA hydrolase [Nesterenkonia sandarakina]